VKKTWSLALRNLRRNRRRSLTTLFAMVIGTLMFHEKQKVRDIAPGALVMLAGVVLLSLTA